MGAVRRWAPLAGLCLIGFVAFAAPAFPQSQFAPDAAAVALSLAKAVVARDNATAASYVTDASRAYFLALTDLSDRLRKAQTALPAAANEKFPSPQERADGVAMPADGVLTAEVADQRPVGPAAVQLDIRLFTTHRINPVRTVTWTAVQSAGAWKFELPQCASPAVATVTKERLQRALDAHVTVATACTSGKITSKTAVRTAHYRATRRDVRAAPVTPPCPLHGEEALRRRSPSRVIAGCSPTGGLASDGRADTVRVHKVVHPLIAATEFAQRSDENDCFYVSCLDPLTTGLPPPGKGGVITVGYDFASHDDGCCNGYSDVVNRGSVLFRTRDIPHDFKAATLVLKAVTTNSSDPGAKVPFGGIYEWAPDFPLRGDTRYDAKLDQFTTTLNLADQFNAADISFADLDPANYATPFLLPFPPPPYPSGRVIEETAPFNFRIDVTANVKAWIQDWKNRNKVELHGFYFVGTKELYPYSANEALLVTYLVTLEFAIDEPDF